jgi:hypothetical protein
MRWLLLHASTDIAYKRSRDMEEEREWSYRKHCGRRYAKSEIKVGNNLGIAVPQNRHLPQVMFFPLKPVYWKLQSVIAVSVHRRVDNVPVKFGLL